MLAMRRMIDITFRLHMGIAKYSIEGVRDALSLANLVRLKKHTMISCLNFKVNGKLECLWEKTCFQV